MMVNKAKRSHKSKAEQKRLNKQRKTKVIGEGRFSRRTAKPETQGTVVKSQLLRVDAGFADWCRKRAEIEGTVTRVTRNLFQRITAAEDSAVSQAVKV